MEQQDRVADQVWLVVEGLWAGPPYADRAELGLAGLALVDQLVPAHDHPVSTPTGPDS